MLAGPAFFWLVSCSSSPTGEPEQPESNPPCTMKIRIDLGSPVNTRTGEAGMPPFEEEPGFGSENYIGIDNSDFRVYLFSTDNVLIKQLSQPLDPADFNIAMVEDGNISYTMDFRVDNIFENIFNIRQSFKIVMLANWGRYPDYMELTPGVTTIENLITDTYPTLENASPIKGEFDTSPLGGYNRIPFYGVKTYSNILFKPGYNVMDQPIEIIRAFAKIMVCWDEKSEYPNKLRGVKITRHSTNFMKAPLNYTGDTDDTDIAGTGELHLPESIVENDIPLDLGKDDKGNFIIYVPEFRNTDKEATVNNLGRPDAERARLDIYFGDGDEWAEKYTADFKYYEGNGNPPPPEGSSVGDFYDIRRNYFYVFKVKRNVYGVSLSADVIPYTEKYLDPSFGLPASK